MIQFARRHISALSGAFVFIAALTSYVSTLATTQVPGDPSEYTFVPWILGIAHPPGYAFFTLLAALWQRLVPIGDVVYRTHLLAATAGALNTVLVFATVLTLLKGKHARAVGNNRNRPNAILNRTSLLPIEHLAAIFAALSFAFATDIWQHSIHTNAHIITLLLATTSIFMLTRWWSTGSNRWLYAFCLISGLSATQHPLLVFGFPAYAAFILYVRPHILREPRTLLKMIIFAALGLSLLLYFPLRSPSTPFGVSDIDSFDSFMHFITAEGLRVNLFAFGLADQPMRLSIFINLLQLQYPTITLLFAAFGWFTLLVRNRQVFILLTIFIIVLYTFVMNTIQDVMAYLMLPFASIAILAGVGLGQLMSMRHMVSGIDETARPRVEQAVIVALAAALIGLPVTTALERAPRVSLQDYSAGKEWVQTVYERFDGKGEGAYLLAPWESLTPLWIEQYVNGRELHPRDVTLVYVAADSANPWLDNVFSHFDLGPVYLADYRREVIEGELFRLRAEGGSPPLWRVVAPGDATPATRLTQLDVQAEDQLALLGYALDRTSLRAGETAYLTLAMRAPITPTHYLMPYARVGDRIYRWTTDSRTLSPSWQRGEVIVERYAISLPFSTPRGDYRIELGVSDLTDGRDLTLSNQANTIALGTLHVEPSTLPSPSSMQAHLADFSAQIALLGASAHVDGQSVSTTSGAWTQPLVARPGQSIRVWLDWQALQQPLDNYKVFVHLITENEQLAAPPADFYTPLGGAFPTHLWIPKWIEGQRVSDPYTLRLPPSLPQGDYRIQVGLYSLTSNRRVYLIDNNGNLAGDRVILGTVQVKPAP